MSWAAMARTVAEKPTSAATSTAPKKDIIRVFAPPSTTNDNDTDDNAHNTINSLLRQAATLTSSSPNDNEENENENDTSNTNNSSSSSSSSSRILLPQATRGTIVLDTNAFIKEAGLERYKALGDVLVTTPSVIEEIKDADTKASLLRIPGLLLLHPSSEAVNKVADVAERTGDLGSLSVTDIRVCALAYECAKQLGALKQSIELTAALVNPNNNSDGTAAAASTTSSPHANITIDNTQQDKYDDDEEEEEEEEGEEEEDWGEEDEAGGKTQTSSSATDQAAAATTTAKKSHVDAWGGDWITPANIQETRAEETGETSAFSGGFACATSDFPMQNTLLHLGVPVIGPRGMMITELRQWLLRCHACFHVEHDTTRQFCAECGSGDTLRRVQYVLNEKGEKKLLINFKRRISTRGTIYSLPKPRGGRRGTNRTLALREDQLRHHGQKNNSKAKAVRAAAAYDPDALEMFGEVKKKQKFNPDVAREQSSYVRRGNINEIKKARAGRRK